MKKLEQAMEDLRRNQFYTGGMPFLAIGNVLQAWDELNRRTEPNEVLTVEAALEMFDCDGCIDYHTFWGKEPCFHCLRNSKRTDELADCYRHKPEESEGEW